jgi:hypothetical protein
VIGRRAAAQQQVPSTAATDHADSEASCNRKAKPGTYSHPGHSISLSSYSVGLPAHALHDESGRGAGIAWAAEWRNPDILEAPMQGVKVTMRLCSV